jgi:hypothetical protein
MAGAYPGYRLPDGDHRTREAFTWAAIVHGAAIALLVVFALLAPEVEDRILHLQILKPPPPPPPPPVVELPKPEPPPPPPVKVELPKPPPPKPPPPRPKPRIEPPPKPPEPAPVPVAKPPPPAPKPPPPVVKPMPAPAPALPRFEPMSVTTPDRVDRPVLPPRATSNVRVPTPQIDRANVRAELAMPAPVPSDPRPTAPRAARTAPPPPPPAAIDRVAVPRPAAAPAAPMPRSAPPGPPARTARPEPIALASAPAEPRNSLRGVPLSALLPCVSDARETELKQRTVAAARNRALCESPAGRFHFVETKNVNAFLMRIEQAPGRRSGDRCEELKLALDCLASLPPRSR